MQKKINNPKKLARKKSLVIKKHPIQQFYRKKLRPRKQTDKIFSSEMSQILKNLPSIVSWKGIDSVYLGCSEKLAKLGNLKSPKAIIGKRASDFPWGADKYSEIFRAQDEEVFSGIIMHVLGKYNFGNKEKMVLVKKMPILDKAHYIVGTFNYITEFRQENFAELVLVLKELGIKVTPKQANNIKTIFFADKFQLSLREEDCAYYLLKGLSAREISNILGLSYRTVQFYIMKLKAKLKCSKISTLILKLIDLGYLHDLPKIMQRKTKKP